ncbi:MAG: LPS export ABC transporter ATP-binding protein [Spirochaetia bacterium]
MPEEMLNYGLTVTGLSKEFGKKEAVKKVSFSVPPGEIIALLGPNGAGKTTTFYMIAGFINPTRGAVYLDNCEITRLSMSQRSRIGLTYLPQEGSVFKKLTVEENIYVALELFRKMNKHQRNRETDQLLEEFQITKLRHQLAHTLSGGERRRLEIARAVATHPRFLLLDEPFAGVDPIAVLSVKKIIQYLSKKGIGILLTDHNVRETLSLAYTSYIMYFGNILVSGDKESILKNEMAQQLYLGNTVEE